MQLKSLRLNIQIVVNENKKYEFNNIFIPEKTLELKFKDIFIRYFESFGFLFVQKLKEDEYEV